MNVDAWLRSASHLWRDSNDLVKAERAGWDWFLDQTDDDRKRVLAAVRVGLLKLLEDPHWVPATVAHDGDELVVTLRFPFYEDVAEQDQLRREDELRATLLRLRH